MIETVKAYRASDGELFESEVEAERHQTFVDQKDLINEFINSDLNQYNNGAQRGIVAKTGVGWEMYKAKKGIKL